MNTCSFGQTLQIAAGAVMIKTDEGKWILINTCLASIWKNVFVTNTRGSCLFSRNRETSVNECNSWHGTRSVKTGIEVLWSFFRRTELDRLGFLPICLRLAKPIVTMFPKTSASGKFMFISHKPPRRANCFKWRTYGTTTPSDHLDLAFEWRQRILEKSWLPHYMKMLVSIATCQRAAFEPTNFWLDVSTGRSATWISVTQQVVIFLKWEMINPQNDKYWKNVVFFQDWESAAKKPWKTQRKYLHDSFTETTISFSGRICRCPRFASVAKAGFSASKFDPIPCEAICCIFFRNWMTPSNTITTPYVISQPTSKNTKKPNTQTKNPQNITQSTTIKYLLHILRSKSSGSIRVTFIAMRIFVSCQERWYFRICGSC